MPNRKERIAYLDCFAGISGDMLLGALIDAGLPREVLHQATAALNLDATLDIHRVDRSGIAATKVDVLDRNRPAEAAPAHAHAHAHPHQPAQPAQPSEAPPTHTHPEARSLTSIRALIHAAALPAEVIHAAIHTFTLLGTSEARIHNVDLDQIHFHEVGAVDAIVDIVAASAGIHYLNQQALAETGQPLQWHASPINVGGGMVDCAHGRFPVPAPATADLLRGLPTYSADPRMELVTPTGAALLRTLNPTFGPQPPMRIATIGYGAGTRNPPRHPNVLRLSLGEADTISNQVEKDPGNCLPSRSGGPASALQTVTILETALDDLSPQILSHVADRALELGALDVMRTPVVMKKGRLGTLLTVLCDDATVPALEHLLLTETSTLGIRIHTQRRSILDRSHTPVDTPYGTIRIKLATRNNETLNAAPEYEDCRAAAAQHNVPIKQVAQAATAAYLKNQP